MRLTPVERRRLIRSADWAGAVIGRFRCLLTGRLASLVWRMARAASRGMIASSRIPG